jgi:hypothetical protein
MRTSSSYRPGEDVLLTQVFRAALGCAEYAVTTTLRVLSGAVPHPAADVKTARHGEAQPDTQTVGVPIRREHPTGLTEAVRFGLDGQAYEIVLSPKDAAALRAAFGQYVAAGRAVNGHRARGSSGGPPGRAARTDHHGDAAAIREWAREHGHRVSDRGPIPAAVREAYRTAR